MKEFQDTWTPLIIEALKETIQMTAISMFFSIIFGVAMGLIIVLTRQNFLFENKIIYNILNVIVKILRSISFIILLFFILTFMKFIVRMVICVKGYIVDLYSFLTSISI